MLFPVLLFSIQPTPIRHSSHHSSKTTRAFRICVANCNHQSSVLMYRDLQAAQQSLHSLASKIPSLPDFPPCLTSSSFLVIYAGSFLCIGSLYTGDLIQSHSFKKHLMRLTPKFIYLAQTSPLDFKYAYIFKSLFNISTWIAKSHVKSKMFELSYPKNHCPPHLSLLQFHPFSCSGQKPWCNP